MPELLALYWNFYDINLEIDKALKNTTIIDFRYYPKSSINKNYLPKVLHINPTLHCKVAIPWWLGEKKEKFDINWQHNQWTIKWKMFWLKS